MFFHSINPIHPHHHLPITFTTMLPQETSCRNPLSNQRKSQAFKRPAHLYHFSTLVLMYSPDYLRQVIAACSFGLILSCEKGLWITNYDKWMPHSCMYKSCFFVPHLFEIILVHGHDFFVFVFVFCFCFFVCLFCFVLFSLGGSEWGSPPSGEKSISSPCLVLMHPPFYQSSSPPPMKFMPPNWGGWYGFTSILK